jgi:FkbM family methyltransferase
MLARARLYVTETNRLSRMAGSPVQRLRFAVVRTVLVARALAGRTGRPYTVCVVEGGRRFRFLVADPSELEVLREVFLDREYDLELRGEPAVIVDLGSNIGAAIVFFRARHPAARIVGLEPDPNAFRRLRANVAGLEDVKILAVAAAAVDDHRPFYPASESWLSSFQARTGEAGEAIEVDTRSLDSLLAELDIDKVGLLKVDVEGAEEEILPAFSGLASVEAVVGEIHPDVVGDPEALVRLLERHFDLEVERAWPDRWRFRGERRKGRRD